MINIIGQIFGTSGYSSHTRNLANALNKLTEVKITTPLQPGFETQINDQELEMLKRQEDFETNLIITHPSHWRVNCYAKRNWVYLIWEGDKVPPWICQECYNNNIDKIICPSQHTYNALKAGFEEWDPDGWLSVGDEAGRNKVVVIPHGVDLDVFKPLGKETSYKLEGDSCKTTDCKPVFKFLANKGFRNLEDRGGIQYLLKAYLEEFTNEDNVELILKINPAYPIGNFQQLFPELSKPNAPKVVLNTEQLTDEQLSNLYNQCDVFVSPTRAEAFNLPCLEALACGKPVITTAFGGQTDFIDKSVGDLIEYDLVPVEHELEYEGTCWSIPDHKDLKKKLRWFYENPKISVDMGKEAEKISKGYSWNRTAKEIEKLL